MRWSVRWHRVYVEGSSDRVQTALLRLRPEGSIASLASVWAPVRGTSLAIEGGEGNAPATTRRCHRFLLRIACLPVQPPAHLPPSSVPLCLGGLFPRSRTCFGSLRSVSVGRGIQDGLSTKYMYQSSGWRRECMCEKYPRKEVHLIQAPSKPKPYLPCFSTGRVGDCCRR